MIFLIDYENIHNAGLEGCQFLTDKDCVMLFFSQDSNTILTRYADQLFGSGAKVEMCKLVQSRKNALDFYIASKVGEYAGREPQEQIAIISRDNGFLAVKEYWEQVAEKRQSITLGEDIETCIFRAGGQDPRAEEIRRIRKVQNLEELFAEYQKELRVEKPQGQNRRRNGRQRQKIREEQEAALPQIQTDRKAERPAAEKAEAVVPEPANQPVAEGESSVCPSAQESAQNKQEEKKAENPADRIRAARSHKNRRNGQYRGRGEDTAASLKGAPKAEKAADTEPAEITPKSDAEKCTEAAAQTDAGKRVEKAAQEDAGKRGETEAGTQTGAEKRVEKAAQADAGKRVEAAAQADTEKRGEAAAQADTEKCVEAAAQTDAGKHVDTAAEPVKKKKKKWYWYVKK